MTVAVCVKVHDGIVLASDSASSMMMPAPGGGQAVSQVYDHANKIFNLRKGLPIGAITFGAGSIGHSSISTLAKDLRSRFTESVPKDKNWNLSPARYSIKTVAERARKFLFEEHYKPAFKGQKDPPALGFWVCGYSARQALSELWSIEIVGGKCAKPVVLRQGDQSGVNWAGQPEAITRLIMGHGQRLPDALVDMGVDKGQVAAAMAQIRSKLEMPMLEPPMPIQDAIDLAKFLVHATKMFSRFNPGAPTVGGDIEIAAITKHEGFKWVSRKHYFNRTLNPEG